MAPFFNDLLLMKSRNSMIGWWPLLMILAIGFVSFKSTTSQSDRYLFYLHGRIIEDQGIDAQHPEYGSYQYKAILEKFTNAGFRVISEPRAKDTDAQEYARLLADDVRELLHAGTPAHHITIVGASKGAVIAMLASAELSNEQVNYVFMANCNTWVTNQYSPQVCGRILSVYETTDTIGKSCRSLIDQTQCTVEFSEIALNTGLKHGFIFRPIDAWITPTIKWARH